MTRATTIEGTAEVARRFYEAFRSRCKEAFEALMAPEFTFTSQYDDHIDSAEFFKRCWPNGEQFSSMSIERITPDADGAYVTYLATVKSGESFRNTEFLRVVNGRVASVEVYFGASYKDGSQLIKSPPA